MVVILGSFSNDDDDGNKNVKNNQNNNPARADYTACLLHFFAVTVRLKDVKFPDGTYDEGRKHEDEFFLLFGVVSKNSTPGYFTYI